MTAALREQLAAAIVQGEDSLPGPSIVIHGMGGSWSVGVENGTPNGDCLWLASARTPSVMRDFKSLDAAHTAAVEIQRLADPSEDYKLITIRVITKLRELPPYQPETE